jgi:hypothetical protein
MICVPRSRTWWWIRLLSAALLANWMAACSFLRHPDAQESREQLLAGYQELLYAVCEAVEPLIPVEDCERHMVRVLAQERNLRAQDLRSFVAGAELWTRIKPYAQEVLDRLIQAGLDWILGTRTGPEPFDGEPPL